MNKNLELDETMAVVKDGSFNELHLKRIKKKFKRKRRIEYMKRSLLVVSCVLILITGALNLNISFAENLSEVPFIGQIVRVLTFNRIEINDEYTAIEIEIPNLEGLKDEKLQEEINKILQNRAMLVYDKTMEEAEKIKEDSKEKGFVSSIPANVSQSYNLLLQDDDYIAFQVITMTVAASGYQTSHIYNIDLKDNKLMKLSDVYEDFDDLNQKIIAEMERRNGLDEAFFIEAFEGISEDTNFYIKGNQLIVVFDEYEVAAGYMGMPEIVIELKPIE